MTVETYESLPGSLYEGLKRSAGRLPKQPALIEEDGKQCSYGELLKRCEEAAEILSRRHQLSRGNRAAILMPSGIGFCVCFWPCKSWE